MRVKRFIGDNVAETMGKIKRELGSEAVILQTRQIKEGGFFGFFARTKVEITAAVEDKPLLDIAEPEENSYVIKTEAIKEAYEKYREKENEEIDHSVPTQVEYTNYELKEMHNLLKEIKGHITRAESEEEQLTLPQPLGQWFTFLTQRGMTSESAAGIIDNVKNTLNQQQWEHKDSVYTVIKDYIRQQCHNTEVIKPRKNKSLVIALIGPTGVGKTTTIGKLAAGFSIIEKRKVALITADTYRVAAVEQLKTFGEIIGVPVEVVMTPDSLEEAVQRHRDKELVFIDTAGRSPNHEIHMSELEAFLNKGKPHLALLVMSVTTNPADQKLVLSKFRNMATHLIFTKLDESSHTGSLFDIMMQAKLPVAYLTNGQNVPDDIDAATPEKLAYCILGEGQPDV